ncbi:MAG: gliding motility-associated C-terminal domain-containing protein [Bacteroidota bacterium]
MQSEEGKGSTFEIKLPIERKADQKEAASFVCLNSERSFSIPPTAEKEKSNQKNLARLLVIEDNPDIVQYLSAFLGEKYELLIAPDGQIGIEMALEHIPDLIVSDVMMPKKNGYEVSSQSSDTFSLGNPIYLNPGNANAQLNYQWYQENPSSGGTPLINSSIFQGANDAQLRITDISALDGKQFCLSISHNDNACIQELRCAELRVIDSPIYTQAVEICEGETYAVGSSVYSVSGTYNDSLLSSMGCDSIVITQLQVLRVVNTFNQISICAGESYSIGNSIYTASGTYVDSFRSTLGCDSIVTTQLTVLPLQNSLNQVSICEGESYTEGSSVYTRSGTYVDTYASISGCDSLVTTELIVIPLPRLEVIEDYEICEGESVILMASGADQYLWSSGDVLSKIRVAPSIDMSYSVIGYTQGCPSETKWVYVRVYPSPIVAFQIDTSILLAPINIKFENMSRYASQYLWDFGDGGNSREEAPTHYYEFEGSYSVSLFATNEIGCTNSTSLPLRLIQTRVFIPTAFSPNGDGVNDQFYISAADIRGIAQFETRIFNRWGKLIYESDQADFRWDGRVNSIPSPEGVYVCQVIIKDIKGKRYPFARTITLFR